MPPFVGTQVSKPVLATEVYGVTVRTPLAGAVHFHHAVWPLEMPSIIGSPASVVALERVPVMSLETFVMTMLLLKLSLAGCASDLPEKTHNAVTEIMQIAN